MGAVTAPRKKQSALETWLAPRKLLFYFLFHGFHVALFIYGW